MTAEHTYESAIKRLEEIVSSLERGGTNLQDTLAMFEEGAALLLKCKQELQEAEGRVNELSLEEAEAMTKED